MTQTIQPLKTKWAIDEDKGFVPDQIKERVNSESNYEWAKSTAYMPITERIKYNESLGRNYLLKKIKYV